MLVITLGSTQISPVEADKVVEKIDNLIEEGFAQVMVTSLNAESEPRQYGLTASRKVVEE